MVLSGEAVLVTPGKTSFFDLAKENFLLESKFQITSLTLVGATLSAPGFQLHYLTLTQRGAAQIQLFVFLPSLRSTHCLLCHVNCSTDHPDVSIYDAKTSKYKL